MGTPDTDSGQAFLLEGLEELRRQELTRISRALHDDVGPSLCSAGLMLGLLRSSWQDLGQETRDMLDSIQDALETSVDAVRLLSYHSNPDIAGRCGLRGALESITKGRAVEVEYGPRNPAFEPEEAEFLCRLVRASLERSVVPGRVMVGESTLTLSGSYEFGEAELVALETLAEAAGMQLYPVPGGVRRGLAARRRERPVTPVAAEEKEA